MKTNHEAWWLEEIKDHYELFKLAASTVFVFAISMASIAVVFNSKKDVQGVSISSIVVFFSGIFPLLLLMWYLKLHFAKINLLLAFLLIEFITSMFNIAAHTFLKDHRVMLCINSTVMTLFYQIGFVKDLKLAFLVVLKHVIVWFVYRVYNGEVAFHFPASIVLVMAFIIYVMVFEYLKREKSYERYFTRKKLEALQRNLQTILDLFPDGLMVINKELSVKYSNFKILEYLNTDKQNLLNALNEVLYIKDRKYFLQHKENDSLFDDIKMHLNLDSSKECSLGLTSVNQKIFEWKIKKIEWEDEESVLITCFDITYSVKLENASAENKTKTSIIKSFSHELRTPISAILHFVELALISSTLTSEIANYLNYVKISTLQLFSQINDILDLSNILAGNFTLMKTVINIREWVTENFEIYNIISKEKSLHFEIVVEKNVPKTIYTDPNRLKQVAYNFVNNSFKFTFKGSVKLVISCVSDEELQFKVLDTGIGIPEERKLQLLDFFSNSEKVYDIGIGLYFCKLMLGYLGNDEILLESSLGIGSDFSFKIRYFDNENNSDYRFGETFEHSIEKKIEQDKFSGDDYDLLIVDDVELNRKIFLSILRDEKLKIIEASNGKEAVNIVKEMDKMNKSIKIIVMDCNMPIMDGWEATKAIKTMEFNRDIKYSPIILGYTAYCSKEDINQCYEAGMSAYLPKPSTPQVILKTINYYLQIS